MDLAELKAALERARCALYAQRTPETMAAYKDAWNALEAATPRRKVGNYACRAGKRQAAERRALYGRR